MITTIFSHPSDAAAAAVKGYKVVTLMQGPDGLPTVEDLRRAVGPRTAGLLITNPEDTGIYNPSVQEFVRLVHEAGGLCGYDQANANGIMGVTRAADCGFDLCFFNLHKTFSTPHGCGGPAGGALGVTMALADYLPVPLVVREGERYRLDYGVPRSIGKTRLFYGTVQVALRAYAWIRALGADGLREVSAVAVLNNNYLLEKIKRIRGASAPYAEGHRRIQQVRYSWEQLAPGHGRHHRGHLAAHGRLRHAPVEQPPPLHRPPALHGGAHRELRQGGAGRGTWRCWSRWPREAYADPQLVAHRPPPQRLPAGGPGAFRRSRALGRHLAALAA